MDLLSDGSSSDNSSQSEGKGGPKQESSSSSTVSRKRGRVPDGGGSVNVVASDDAPADLFPRTVPHKRGHWAGHILIPLQQGGNSLSRSVVPKSIREFQRTLESQGYSGTILQHSHLHISLSKHFSLQLHFIESFVSRLTRLLSLECASRVFIDQSPFLLVNDEKTRSFWSWKVHPASWLKKMVSHIDTILKDYNQPTYYDPPVFHISIASFGGNLTDLSLAASCPSGDDETASGDDHDSDSEPSEDDSPLIVVNQVICQFGTTKRYTINLPPVP